MKVLSIVAIEFTFHKRFKLRLENIIKVEIRREKIIILIDEFFKFKIFNVNN